MNAKSAPLSDDLTDFLFGSVSREGFEELAKRLFAAEHGEKFVPLGGMHDGGADALLPIGVFASDRPEVFFQFSKTDAPRAATKISDTIKALRKAGRDPKKLIYATSARIPKWDLIADSIFQEDGVLVLVRDLERIRQSIRTKTDLGEIFRNFFAGEIGDLARQAKALKGAVNKFVADPTVFALLDFELKDRFSRDQLYDRILDSLIYWALRDTDPAQDRFLSEKQISQAVIGVFPSAQSLLAPKLGDRLAELTKKYKGDGERIRAYKRRGLYCLPAGMREELAARNAAEMVLQEDVAKSIHGRIEQVGGGTLEDFEIEFAASLAFESLHQYFVEQGMILAAFLARRVDGLSISDQVVETIVETAIISIKTPRAPKPEAVQCTLAALRSIFYTPNSIERRYLEYLTRTSLLFFTLQSAPQLIEYFNQLAGKFRLIVGSDLLIKALSEAYLPEESRQITNLLAIMAHLGTELLLAEPVVHEVFTHLHATDLEFRNHYAHIEQYVTSREVSECDRIFIRTYFYAKRQENGPKSWSRYIDTITDPDGLRGKKQRAEDQLRATLLQRFQMTSLTWEAIDDGVDEVVRGELARQLGEARGDTKPQELSDNDASLVCAVYALRQRGRESAIYDGFGLRTWWLTKETHVLAYTSRLVAKNGNVPYVMRPEFLLNYILLAPTAAEVRQSFRKLLPTTVGLQLGQHLDPRSMQEILDGVADWAGLPADRISTKIQDRVDKLKSDRFKRYIQRMG